MRAFGELLPLHKVRCLLHLVWWAFKKIQSDSSREARDAMTTNQPINQQEANTERQRRDKTTREKRQGCASKVFLVDTFTLYSWWSSRCFNNARLRYLSFSFDYLKFDWSIIIIKSSVGCSIGGKLPKRVQGNEKCLRVAYVFLVRSSLSTVPNPLQRWWRRRRWWWWNRGR